MVTLRTQFSSRTPSALPLASMAVLAFILVLGAQAFRPLPFATTDDNWMYFLPLIKAHTDSLLSGRLLEMLWSLGAGWTPFENGQVGLFYIPFHLANLIARVLGQPLAILEVTAWLHLLGAGLAFWYAAPGKFEFQERLGWSFLAMVAPGPLLLGLNWIVYLTGYPWFLAMTLVLAKWLEEGAPGPGWERPTFAILSMGFYLASHVQMYVIGITLLLLWALAVRPGRACLRPLAWVLALQLPMLPSLIHLTDVAAHASSGWMEGRDSSFYILRHAQSLKTALLGTLGGNLVPNTGFALWSGISQVGVGMFFAPPVVALAYYAILKRRWALIAFLLFSMAMLGIATFPWLRHVAIGPFGGFRWTWKLTIFIYPLALVTIAPRLQELIGTPRWRKTLLAVCGAISILVFYRGLRFEIWPSLTAAHSIGASGLVRETRAMMEACDLKPGQRIALMGPTDMVEPLPLAMLGCVGNAPILSGLETAHLYEPMEADEASRRHLALSLPWRGAVPTEAFLNRPDAVMGILRSIGVHALLGNAPELASVPTARRHVDRLERPIWVIPTGLTESGPFPFLNPSAGHRLAGGELQSSAPVPPPLFVARDVRWSRFDSGLRGRAVDFPWFMAILTLAFGAGVVVAGFRLRS